MAGGVGVYIAFSSPVYCRADRHQTNDHEEAAKPQALS